MYSIYYIQKTATSQADHAVFWYGREITKNPLFEKFEEMPLFHITFTRI